jgi:ATP-dependent DNA helicase RecG
MVEIGIAGRLPPLACCMISKQKYDSSSNNGGRYKLIFGTETETLELKRSTSETKEALKDISAILNKHGHGELYFGIRSNGLVIGQEFSEKTLRDFGQAVGNHIEPKIYPTIDAVQIDSKDCIRVVFDGDEAPYLYDGKAYIRVADESLAMSSKELERFYATRKGIVSDWESLASDIGLDEIDENLIRGYIGRANESGRIDWGFSATYDTLIKLGLTIDGKPRNAAKVLFSTRPELSIQMAKFATEKRLTFTDIRQATGTVFELVDVAEQYLIDAMNWRVELNGSLQRKEIPEVPLAALREALLNSYCHRLLSDSQFNEVAIYKDRIEIYNPGKFPDGFSPEDFINESEPPIHRNPLLAQTMYYSNHIEHFGTGLNRIDDECRAAGVHYEFKPTKRGFKVVFYRINEGFSATTEVAEVAERVAEVAEPITAAEQAVLDLIEEYPEYTTAKMGEVLGVSRQAVSKTMQRLKQKGAVIRLGSDTKGHWQIVESKCQY